MVYMPATPLTNCVSRCARGPLPTRRRLAGCLPACVPAEQLHGCRVPRNSVAISTSRISGVVLRCRRVEQNEVKCL